MLGGGFYKKGDFMDLGLYHNSHEFYCRSVFGAVPSGSQVVLRLRADKNIEENWQASVRLWQSNAGETIVPMTWEARPSSDADHAG